MIFLKKFKKVAPIMNDDNQDNRLQIQNIGINQVANLDDWGLLEWIEWVSLERNRNRIDLEMFRRNNNQN